MPDYRPFPDDLPNVYDRARTGVERERVLFREDAYSQAAEHNEESTILRGKIGRVGDLVARSGDVVEGCEILIDRGTGTLTLGAGRIYVCGDVRPVEAATIAGVAVIGDVQVGVRLLTSFIGHEDDPDLLGLHPGAEGEGEAGAAREVATIAWAIGTDGGEGDFYPVYNVKDGYVVDQTPPPSLTGVESIVGRYDYDALGNYIVRGLEVIAVGSDGDGNAIFSISAGVANILGRKRTKGEDIRFSTPEEPDLETVASEPQTFVDRGDGTAVIAVNRPPINGVIQAVVTKETTETITRGATANTSDALSNTGVSAIVSVVQGGTTYSAGTSYVRNGDRVDWSPGGPEPATGSSYTVTYRYLDAVTPDAVAARTVTLSGGVDGEPVFLSYSYKLPRVDRLCIDAAGNLVYLKGRPSREQPRAPRVPSELLSLSTITIDWFGKPIVNNDGVRSIPFETQTRFFNRLLSLLDLAAVERLQNQIALREPVAKYGVFVDPFESDRWRDAGEVQTAAAFQGSLQIAIDPSFVQIKAGAPLLLDYTETFAIVQEWSTSCMKINPYQNFDPPAPRMSLSPAVDYWSETDDQWLSPQTQVFGSGNSQRVASTEIIVTEATARATFLRQIEVDFVIQDLGEGETLDELLFDGIDVTPGPLAANAQGVIEGSFTIPENVVAGTKAVRATTGADRAAGATFTGEGRIDVIRRQQLTTIEQFDVVTPESGGSAAPILAIRTRRPFNQDGGNDPLAQSFAFTEGQHISGVDVQFCAIGDRSKPVICRLVTMENGFPTTEMLMETEIDMGLVIVGQWISFDFPVPIYLPANRQFALVFMTDDASHALSIAERDQFDAGKQQFVGAQPYTVGVLFSSSNAVSWTAHQDADLTCRIRAARFTPVEKTIPLGVHAVSDVSDLMVEAAMILPTEAAKVLFRLTPEGEGAVYLEPGAAWERVSDFSGNIAVDIVLSGSATVSPIVAPDMLMILGDMRDAGDYVSRTFEVGEDKTVKISFASQLPSGSDVTVKIDDGDGGGWTTLAQDAATVLADGTVERHFVAADWAGPEARIKLELTGSPAARPALHDLRAVSY